MRAQITQIIDGVRYDTEKAEIVASNEVWDGHNWERNGRNKHLYKSANGRFFVGYSTLWQGQRCYIEAVSEDTAMQLYEELPEQEIEYEQAFGIEPEEA